MRRFERRVPPLVLMAFCIGGMVWSVPAIPAVNAEGAGPGVLLLSLAPVLMGLAIMLAGVQSFRLASTTVDPLHPERASALVTGGIFRLTRNPMYLGMVMVLLGLAIWLRSLVPGVWLLFFVVWIDRFQIVPEERILKECFGHTYASYCQKVRRWF